MVHENRLTVNWDAFVAGHDLDLGTAGTDVLPGPSIASTRPTADVLTDKSGDLRSRVRLLSRDVDETHQLNYKLEWSVGTQKRAASSPQALLGDLALLGFAWRDLARLIGVSVPAIQKWRRGEGASGENRQRLASLLAGCDLIRDHYLVSEITSWFEMPIVEGIPVTSIDLWATGNQHLVFEYASGHVDPESALTAFDEEWREHYRSDFETFVGDDGKRSIRVKS